MGNLVQEILDAAKVSVLDAAAYSGIPKSNIYRYLRGDTEPTIPILQELAAACGLKIEFLLLPNLGLSNPENLLNRTGVYWDENQINLRSMTKSNTNLAIKNMRAKLPELIWATAALEGNTLDKSAVSQLINGESVDENQHEVNQVLALQETFNFLDGLISTNSFRLNEHTSNEFHARVARHEAIESGHFRGLGSVTGGGTVRLSTGGTVEGLPTDQIPQRFEGIVDIVKNLEDPRLGALVYFAAATRSQFYFDGNKRTARMMASGILLENGYDAINIPFERRLEYNKCLDVLFTTNNATPIMAFVASCA